MIKAVLKEEWIGRVVDGKFPLLEWLGGSGSTGVFRTETKATPSGKAAVRVIQADSGSAKALLASWELAAGLSHPHLMRVLASGPIPAEGDAVYFVTEFADESLSQIIPQRALTPDEVKEMLPPIVDALSYLHGRGLVYRELRPSNILVVDNQIKLPLEGLVRADIQITNSAAQRIYDAPETGTLNASPAADVWSLGVTVVEALTQRPPAWNRTANADPAVPASLPAPLAEIARRSLRRNPVRRLTLGQIKPALSGGSLPPDPATEAKPAFNRPSAAPAPPAAKPTSPSARPAPANPAPPAPPLPAAPVSTPVTPIPAREDRPPALNRRLWLLVGSLVLVVLVVIVLATRSHHNAASPGAQTMAPPDSGSSASSPSPAPTSAPPAASGSSQGAVVSRAQPDIPDHAMHTIRGKIDITARLRVDPAGNVTSATLEHRGSSRYFATRALDAVRGWKFKAPQQDGHPVPSEWNVHFELRRSGIDADATQVHP